MGAPAGHPFYGNQFTDGGYIRGSFTYKVLDSKAFGGGMDALRTVAGETQKRAAADVPKKDFRIPKMPPVKKPNKASLIIGGIGVLAAAAVGGLIFAKSRQKARARCQNSIELENVGACAFCGQSLIGSEYFPESAPGRRDDYILCRLCGGKNYARYPDESEPVDKSKETQHVEEERNDDL